MASSERTLGDQQDAPHDRHAQTARELLAVAQGLAEDDRGPDWRRRVPLETLIAEAQVHATLSVTAGLRALARTAGGPTDWPSEERAPSEDAEPARPSTGPATREEMSDATDRSVH